MTKSLTIPKPTFGRRPVVEQRFALTPLRYPTRVVRIVDENGRLVEKVGPPLCLWPQVGFRKVLGPDHYVAGSDEHLERRRELGLELKKV